MERKQKLRPIKLFLGFLILIILFSLVSVKIWGKRLLKEDSFRQELTFRGEMTVSEFGEINRLPHPLLKKVFGLNCKGDFQKKLNDFDLLQNEIWGRVNNELFLQVKNENSLVKLLKWTVKKLLYNFGWVTQDIQRSGQTGMIGLRFHYWLFPFKSVINLAWEPEKSEDQVFEKNFCGKRNIGFYNFSWNPGRPKDWREVDRVIEIIDKCQKPVWIHCKGGKDRTGGLVAIWKKGKGYPMGLIFEDFQKHGIPAYPWVQELLKEDIGHPAQVKKFLPVRKIETD